MTARWIPFALLGALLAAACRKEPDAQLPQEQEPAHDGRIAVPAAVRANLGIRFVAVERRRVAATLRVPGRFELQPSARREYRTPLAGRVEIVARPLQQLAEGDVLYRLDSPTWRTMQRELGEITTSIAVTKARLDAMRPLLAAHKAHEQSLREAIGVMESRLRSLEETRASVGGQAPELANASVQMARMRADLAEAEEQHASTQATIAELEANALAAADRYELALDAAAAVVASDRARLVAVDAPSGQPAWRALATLEVRAVAAGTADELKVASGGWVETGDLVVTSADVTQLRFRARGLQSDLGKLRAGLPAAIVAPRGSSGMAEPMRGTLELGVSADAEQRTIDLFVRPEATAPFARPGVAAFLEIETETGAESELAVPLSAVVHDGMQRVLFRRDPKDQDAVLRVEADLGLDDGRWVEVKSGLKDGDEVVLEGNYELMLASSGSAQKGGHFHADGTFHAEDHK